MSYTFIERPWNRKEKRRRGQNAADSGGNLGKCIYAACHTLVC